MDFEHEFTVPMGVGEAWEVLLDVQQVAPYLPGATLTDVRRDEFSGTMRMRLGPVSLMYAGRARFVEKDAAARRVVVDVAGEERRGSGTARATLTATLAPAACEDGEGTVVHVHTDLTVTGRPAQFGRDMLRDAGSRLVRQFADNLATSLLPERVAAPWGVRPTVTTPSGGVVAGSTPPTQAPPTPTPTPTPTPLMMEPEVPAEQPGLLTAGVPRRLRWYAVVPAVAALAGIVLAVWSIRRRQARLVITS
ncbi:SRPBCC family protein [Actinopolymorpha alba]|uniref:SRPBCC family protein n=1 Tax=Actinopolymorpha alba TaxID=533267 RepID=UPI000369F453|nr:SRPBCC family protein [Actinopolymorpha alba]